MNSVERRYSASTQECRYTTCSWSSATNMQQIWGHSFTPRGAPKFLCVKTVKRETTVECILCKIKIIPVEININQKFVRNTPNTGNSYPGQHLTQHYRMKKSKNHYNSQSIKKHKLKVVELNLADIIVVRSKAWKAAYLVPWSFIYHFVKMFCSRRRTAS